MRVVIPLAGPDFVAQDGAIKAEKLVDGQPLLRRTLETRPWWKRRQSTAWDLVFVLKDSADTRRFAMSALSAWYPGAAFVYVGRYTGGAALSALAGLALIAQGERVFCVDLVDIGYRSDFDPLACFAKDRRLGAAALVFPSSSPAYSYLKVDISGNVIDAVEKRVISDNASAGTYFFASPSVFLDGIARNLKDSNSVTYNGLFFVCPVLKGVVEAGLRVVVEPVTEVVDIKIG